MAAGSEIEVPAELTPPPVVRPAAILRGGARGLEIVVDGGAPADAITDAVTTRLEEAPGFFRGSDVRVRVEDGPLAAGCLARLDEVAVRFELRIVEVAAGKRPDAVPRPHLAAGSAPVTEDATISHPEPEPGSELEPVRAAELVAPVTDASALAPPADPSDDPEIIVEHALTERVRTCVGPVRSGVVLEHRGHVIVFGDVNPGAEVRAEGNIVVLGRLRGTAHAGIGADGEAFILALRLEPQQLRIGRSVARASDTERPGQVPEIAHIAGGSIVVERYTGRLPGGLAAGIC